MYIKDPKIAQARVEEIARGFFVEDFDEWQAKTSVFKSKVKEDTFYGQTTLTYRTDHLTLEDNMWLLTYLCKAFGDKGVHTDSYELFTMVITIEYEVMEKFYLKHIKE